MPDPTFKVCPQCGQPLALYMTHCGKCRALQPSPASVAASAPVSSRMADTSTLTRVLLVLGIICASAYLFNCLQGWYIEARAVQFVHNMQQKQDEEQAQRQQRAEQSERDRAAYYGNMRNMDTGQPMSERNPANTDMPAVPDTPGYNGSLPNRDWRGSNTGSMPGTGRGGSMPGSGGWIPGNGP